MKEKLNKACVLMLLIVLVGMNLIPNVVYASNVIAEMQDSNQENIVFDSNINGSKSVSEDISNELGLYLNLSLKNGGYLKDVKITLEGNNYVISKDADEINKTLMNESEISNVNKIINGIDDNVILLKEIESGEEINATIPIKFNKEELVSKEDLESDSTVIMTAIYVDPRNNETEVRKTINEHLKWKIKAENEISQKLIRYLKFDNKTMLSFEITNSIKDNSIPAVKKEIEVSIPTINNTLPDNISVAGDNIEENHNGNTLIIKQSKEAKENGKYEWKTDDKYIVTYIYNVQSDETIISTSATSKITTLGGETIEGNTAQSNYEVNSEIGSIVQGETLAPNEINKGYMYTNINRGEEKLDTTYNVNYKVNIGYAELTDRVTIEEQSPIFTNDNGEILLDGSDYIASKKVSVDKEELVKLFGEEGKVVVRDSYSKELGVLNKDNTTIEIKGNKLFFITSKPEKEGLLNINVEKAINGKNNITVQGMLAFKSLVSQVIIRGYNNDYEMANSNSSFSTRLTEPTSNASIDLNTETLSTITGNSDVVFNVVLDTSDISNALYVDPVIKINFPEEVTSITPKSAKVIYDDQLLIEKIETEGRSIVFTLKGTQNKYNQLDTTKGTLLQFIADIELNELAPSNDTKISMEYTNPFIAETKIAEKEIKIVAPNKMITTNQIDVDGQTAYAMNKDADILRINTKSAEKIMKVTGQIVNNVGDKVENAQIIGRIPSNENKTIGGSKLGSNINTSLATPVEVNGINGAIVYYSNNIEEAVNGQGWQQQATSDSKSFKIVLPSVMENKQYLSFNYTVVIPEGLEYEQVAKQNYGIYYNAETQNGLSQFLEESKVLGVETGLAPAIRIGVTAIDANQGNEIENGGKVQEGQYILYRIKVSNSGSETANNVSIAAALPNGLTLVIPEKGNDNNKMQYFRESSSKVLVQNVGTLVGGEDATFEFTAKVNSLYEGYKDFGEKLSTTFKVGADILGDNLNSLTYSVNAVSGYFGIKLATDATGIVESNQDINYQLTLNNANVDNKTNTKIKLKLPKNIVYTDIDEKFRSITKFDKKDNSLVIDLGTFEGNSSEIINIKAQNYNTDYETLTASAEVSCDGLNGTIKSNNVDITTQATNSELSVKQNISNASISDNDIIEFYTDITNSGLKDGVIQYHDDISEKLGVLEYRITIDGEVADSGKTNYIDKLLTIPSGKTVRIFIQAKPYPFEQGKTITIENKPTITTMTGNQISVENVNVNVSGTAQIQTNEIIENGNTINSEVNQPEKGYRILGNVWLDLNKDGVKGIDEDKIADLTVKLYDVKNNKVAQNDKGDEIKTSTNEFGQYEFINVKPGNYCVLAMYDSLLYEISKYRADNIEQSLNSDFVKAIQNGKEIAATDIITIKDSSVFNIDLGFIKKDQFNLAISQTINRIAIARENSSRTISFDNDVANLELTPDELENSTIVVEYTIKIANNGDIAGYAKTIESYIPKGFSFNSQMNPEWYQAKDGNIYSTTLMNDCIETGESKDIKLVFTKKIEGNGIGLTRGKSEIRSTYNERGLQDIHALSSNYANGESNMASSSIVVWKKTNVKKATVVLLTISILGIITFAGYLIKKNIINKMYKVDEID